MIALERQSILTIEISAAGSRQGVASVLLRIAREFGFRHFSLVRAPVAADTQLGRLIVETNLPADYIREFDRHRLLRKCLLSSLIADYALPFCWMLDGTGSDVEWPVEFTELQRQYDMAISVAMGLHSIDGTAFEVRLDGNRPRLTQVELNEIGMLLLQAFSVFDRIRRQERRPAAAPLTMRELEVVGWTAQGKTSSEIGQILSLSDHTINAYLTNAIKKLDCVNRTQLVATALRMKLIA